MANYSDLVELRTLEADGLREWTVVKEDSAFKDIVWGWNESNKSKWLEHTPGRDVVIQAGGYNGVYPRLFSQIFGKVYTFEPHPLSFYCLVQNCQVDNIIKINGFLGDEAKMLSCSDFNPSNPGLHHNVHSDHNTVPQFRIDDFKFEKVDLIQLDVEGYETNVLRGAEKTIERCKPTISCERGGGEVIAFLSAFGYKEVDKTFDDLIYKA